MYLLHSSRWMTADMFLMTWLTRADKLKKMNRYVDNVMKLESGGIKSKFICRRLTPYKIESQDSSTTFRAVCL